MDAILKALGDKTRRDLLDSLRAKDGQTLTELEASLTLSRFGVMKHLKLLEDAGLVLTRREGRFKYHYLNAAPLQEVVDRWIEPLTRQPAARALLDLKARLEGDTAVTTKPDFMLETYIAATPEAIWEALTSAEISRQYYIMGAGFHGELTAGAPYQYRTADGKVMLSGTIIAADPPTRLEMTFLPGWGANPQPSRNVYEIEEAGDHSKLTILHYDIPLGNEGVTQGWAKIAAGLKTLLETGSAVRFG
ncbi:MAG: ArsR/SmtB family transcription factor [Sphingomonas sp.]